MDTIITIAQFLLSLSLLIVLHELGHFLPAKWFKTKVEKFYLFFDAPPFNSLWKIKRGETEYGIGWLPLGGYVKISGMVDESMDTEALKSEPQPWEFRSKPAWQRLIIMVGGVTVNFLLGFFIFAMLLWIMGKAYVPSSELHYGIAMDSLLIEQGLKSGDRIVRIGDRPFERFDPGAFVQAVVFDGQRNIEVIRDGQPLTVTLSDDIAKILTGAKGQHSSLMGPRIPFEVFELVPGQPAENAGLKKGDRIVEVNGQATPYYDQFVAFARANKGQKATIGILRGEDTLRIPISLTPQGTIGVQARTAGWFKEERQYYNLFQALPAGVGMGVEFLRNQMRAFGMMFSGQIGVRENLGSVISIGKLYGKEWNWERFWTLTASLSILLAFMNLLPIPALDGGYVVFLIWEVITGRRVSDSVMEKAVTVGFFLLLGLMIFALGNDIWKHWLQKLF